MRWGALLRGLVAAGGAWWCTSCAPSGFAVESLVQSVRVLASGADPVYAQPGQSVNVQVLAFDGRSSQPEPMQVYWLPFWCKNPADDAYFACFTQLADDGGAPEGGPEEGGAGASLGQLRPGVDLGSIPGLLQKGPTFQFAMPSDIVTMHAPGSHPPSYGLAILFNAACAGHLEYIPPSGNNPQQVPLGCFDQAENQLGADDWVFGYTRVYAFAPDALDGGPLLNQNPVIDSVDVQGQSLAVSVAPTTTQIYTTQAISTPRCSGSCPSIPIGPIVPPSSWEVNPEETDVHGNPLHEEIWADFYTTFGSFSGDTGLLYDATSGSIGDAGTTDNQWTPPSTPGTGFIWIVVHDDRGGASWVTVPVTVQ
ncbi:MAG TPA: hypothetical protein VIF09_21885 [Polyangiaceae bacterium]